MLFDSRELHLAKDLDFAHDYEDAFSVNAEGGFVAVADGVASGIFSRQWASLLTERVASGPPDLYDTPAFQAWLAELRQEWMQVIDFPNLAWNQRAKLNMVGGAYSTLLWIEFYPPEESPENPDASENSQTSQEIRMRCFAVGDCCLFHIRDGKLLRTFPMETAAQFDADPVSVSSVNFNRDHQLEFGVLDEICLPGDVIWVCTDAIGKWAMTQIEAETPPDWDSYWDKGIEEWTTEIEGHRVARAMRRDDSTLIQLRMGFFENGLDAAERTDVSEAVGGETVVKDAEATETESVEAAAVETESREPISNETTVNEAEDPSPAQCETGSDSVDDSIDADTVNDDVTSTETTTTESNAADSEIPKSFDVLKVPIEELRAQMNEGISATERSTTEDESQS